MLSRFAKQEMYRPVVFSAAQYSAWKYLAHCMSDSFMPGLDYTIFLCD